MSVDVSNDSEPALPIEPVRSADIWYEDGTLVVRAEYTLFRVYRGILAAQSEVFNDMLSVPQPPSAETETFDGCPVVRVQDTAEDMSRFLRALTDTRYFSRECHYSAPHLVSILRLAAKYDTAELHESVLTHLLDAFPTSSLYEYDLAQERRLRFNNVAVITLTNVAYALELPGLCHPLALTCAVDLLLGAIVDGLPTAEPGGSTGATRRVELDWRVKRDVLRVRTGILATFRQMFRDLPRIRRVLDKSCTSTSFCQVSLRQLETSFAGVDWMERINMPPWSMQQRLDGPSRRAYNSDCWHWLPLSRPNALGLCPGCCSSFSRVYTAVRVMIWDNLRAWSGDRREDESYECNVGSDSDEDWDG